MTGAVSARVRRPAYAQDVRVLDGAPCPVNQPDRVRFPARNLHAVDARGKRRCCRRFRACESRSLQGLPIARLLTIARAKTRAAATTGESGTPTPHENSRKTRLTLTLRQTAITRSSHSRGDRNAPPPPYIQPPACSFRGGAAPPCVRARRPHRHDQDQGWNRAV